MLQSESQPTEMGVVILTSFFFFSYLYSLPDILTVCQDESPCYNMEMSNRSNPFNFIHSPWVIFPLCDTVGIDGLTLPVVPWEHHK